MSQLRLFTRRWLALVMLAVCGAASGAASSGQREVTRVAAADSAAEASPAPLVVFLGNSLTAGLGLPEHEAFPALLQEQLSERGCEIRIVNAGVSGDTTAGGLERLAWLLAQDPAVMVIELGANDGLRGLSIEDTESNLRQIADRSLASGAKVLLVGIRVPPNYGADYSRRFAEIFPRLADQLGVPLVPFLLEGVAAVRGLNLADGLHPNAAGHRRMAENVLPYLEKVLGAP